MIAPSDGLLLFGKRLSPLDPAKVSSDPDWVQCDPAYIRKALKQALARPTGGWYVVDASRSIGAKPSCYRIAGKELVAYRSNGKLVIGNHACPHLAGPLGDGRTRDGKLVCPWHGLAIPPEGHGAWKPLSSYDDGVLSWVRLGTEAEATDRPILPERPATFIDSVIRKEADCEPSDVIANRLDPWHGSHYHPHTFARLKATDVTLDAITVRVAYRLWGPACIEVDARFHSPEPRTIVMTILEGEGAGSVVETHATPIGPGRSAVIEATLAASDRPGFRMAALLGSAFIRPFISRAAHRLWVEDSAYAERTFQIRSGKRA